MNGERNTMRRFAAFTAVAAVFCFPALTASAQTGEPVTDHSTAAADAIDKQALPPKSTSRRVSHSRAAEKAIIIVGGHSQKRPRTAGQPPGTSAMLNPQPLPPKSKKPKSLPPAERR
jgi:hypothetical protein